MTHADVGSLINELSAIEDDRHLCRIVSKYGIKPSMRARFPTPPDTDGPKSIECDVLPVQLAPCIAHIGGDLRPRDGKKLCMAFIGDATDTFIYVCELLRTHYDDTHYRLVACTPLSLPLLAYGAHRPFSYTCIAVTNDAFIQVCNRLKHTDLIVLNIGNDDINVLLTCTDMFLSRGCAILLTNIRDPGFPNTAKLWKMCCDNAQLRCHAFTANYPDTGLTGGGLGYIRLQ
jgi:hypothetical protein